MGKNRSMSKSGFESIKSELAIGGPYPRRILSRESRQWYDDVAIIIYEASIEVSKSEERLNIFDFSRSWPVHNDFDFVFSHSEAFGRKDIAKIFDGVFVPFALVRTSVEF